MTSTRPDPTDEASPGQAPTSRRARLFVGVAWIGVAVIAAMLIAQRHAQAMSSGLGADLEIFLDAATIARAGGDVYDAVGYTYTPLLAWLLMPLAGTDASMAVWTAIQLACGAVAVALVVVTLRDRLPGWRAPLIAGIGVVSLFYNSKLVLESSLGQTQLLLLAVIALAVLLGRRSPIASGIVLMVAALVKTWPAMLLLWLLRAGQPRRLAAVLAALSHSSHSSPSWSRCRAGRASAG